MLAGLLQLQNSNFEVFLRKKFNAFSRDAYGLAPTEDFEGVLRRKFAAIGYPFLFSPVSSQLNKSMEKNMQPEKLKIDKTPAECQDVCLKTFCAALQLEHFNVENLPLTQR